MPWSLNVGPRRAEAPSVPQSPLYIPLAHPLALSPVSEFLILYSKFLCSDYLVDLYPDWTLTNPFFSMSHCKGI